MDKKLLFQFEYVRRTGMTNMLDSRAVAILADNQGFYELVNAISDGDEYSKLLHEYKRPDEVEYRDWLEETRVRNEQGE